MTPASLIVFFGACSLFGWLFESVYAVLRTGKWDRRGFLYGPVCPIYGVGVVAIVIVVDATFVAAGADYAWWQIFLVAFLGSMVLEYVTSWAMEKLFHAYWWDYHGMPLNLNGRTCIPAGLLFGAGGVLAIYVLEPAWLYAVSFVPGLVVEIASYVVVILFAADFTLTINALKGFQAQVMALDERFNSQAEKSVERMVESRDRSMERLAESRDRSVEYLVESRDKFYEDNIADLVEGMEKSKRAAVSRIKGFRHAFSPDAESRVSKAIAALRGKGK